MTDALTKTVALRLPPKLYRAITRAKAVDETLSDTVRRLLSRALQQERDA